MSNRKRVNISLDTDTYEKLQRLRREHGFKNLCEMVVAVARILVDRTEEAAQRRYDLPEDEGAYIDRMFGELGNVQRTPDGTVPVRHNRRRMD